jgi:hypothetical protein
MSGCDPMPMDTAGLYDHDRGLPSAKGIEHDERGLGVSAGVAGDFAV